MSTVKLVPWRRVENWFCIACGECCREFKVLLRTYEAVRFANIFGYKCLELGLRGYVLRKRADGRCVFQVYSNGKWVCSVQSIKPLACKLWPFFISERPQDFKEEAEYEFKGYTFYVYVNPFCRGLVYGKPTTMFAKKVVPEFIELSLGLRREQTFSTSLLLETDKHSFQILQHRGYLHDLSKPNQSLLANNQVIVWCLQL